MRTLKFLRGTEAGGPGPGVRQAPLRSSWLIFGETEGCEHRAWPVREPGGRGHGHPRTPRGQREKRDGVDVEPRLRGGKPSEDAQAPPAAAEPSPMLGRRAGGGEDAESPAGTVNDCASRMALRAALRRFDPPRVRAGPRSHRLGRRQRQTFGRAAQCRSPCSRRPGGGRRGEQGADGSAWRPLRAPPQTGTQAVRRRAAPTGRGERPLWGSLQVSGGAGWTVLLGTE